MIVIVLEGRVVQSVSADQMSRDVKAHEVAVLDYDEDVVDYDEDGDDLVKIETLDDTDDYLAHVAIKAVEDAAVKTTKLRDSERERRHRLVRNMREKIEEIFGADEIESECPKLSWSSAGLDADGNEILEAASPRASGRYRLWWRLLRNRDSGKVTPIHDHELLLACHQGARWGNVREAQRDVERANELMWEERPEARGRSGGVAFLGDEFDDAVIGRAWPSGSCQPMVAYSKERVLRVLEEQGMEPEEAIDYYEYNIAGAVVAGAGSPCYLEMLDEFDDGRV